MSRAGEHVTEMEDTNAASGSRVMTLERAYVGTFPSSTHTLDKPDLEQSIDAETDTKPVGNDESYPENGGGLETHNENADVEHTTPPTKGKESPNREAAAMTVEEPSAQEPQVEMEGQEVEVEKSIEGADGDNTSGNDVGTVDAIENSEVSQKEDTVDAVGEPAQSSDHAKSKPQETDHKSNSVEGQEAPSSSKDDDSKEEKPKFELPYSTRGRTQPKEKESSEFDGSSTRGGYRDNTSDAGIDALSDIGPGRQDPLRDVSGTSFLESLGEEERRLRTRYLPAVDGFRVLYKSEIKRDLSLARTIVSGSTSAQSQRKGRSRRPSRSDDEDRMDVDEGLAQSEDDRASDVSSRPSSTNAELESRDLVSAAFIAPPEDCVVMSNGESMETNQGSTVPPSKRWHSPKIPSLVVEAMTAFDPPRPTESVGPKKKSRMLRWERRPQDVEHDLRVNRKTVQKAREELHRAENERERIEIVGSALRVHFLNHLKAIQNENRCLNEELASIQVDCVKAADLLTSRTRSRGVGKGVYVMRDVISVLKSRGSSLDEKSALPYKTNKTMSRPGIGGVSAVSFVDWDSSTRIAGSSLGEAWILPGDKVKTPYGDGVALHVYGPSFLDVEEAPIKYPATKQAEPSSKEKGDLSSGRSEKPVTPNNHGFGSGGSAAAPQEADPEPPQGSGNGSIEGPGKVTSGPISGPTEPSDEQKAKAETADDADEDPGDQTSDASPRQIILPRVAVRLPFGVGFFPVDSVTSLENPSSYSDSMLAARWKKYVDSSLSVGTCLDVAGMEYSKQMANSFGRRTSGELESGDDASAAGGSRIGEQDRMEVDNEISTNDNEALEGDAAGKKDGISADASSHRFLPVGAGMLPTASGRGVLLGDTPVGQLESEVNTAFSKFASVLGDPDNPGVPEAVKRWERNRYETCVLKAEVLQLRNELYRQRRIRTLNERTFVSSRDRSHRAENLLKEMKSDLKSLKNRLQEEVLELGIDEERAASLLASYYNEDSEGSTIDATPPPKRKRKAPKEPITMEPKHTRRRAADSLEEGAFDDQGVSGPSGNEMYGNDKLSSRLSGDEIGMDQSSEDDTDSRRAPKRARVAA